MAPTLKAETAPARTHEIVAQIIAQLQEEEKESGERSPRVVIWVAV